MTDKLFSWVERDGKKRLVRTGPWKLLFAKPSAMTLWIVFLCLMFYGYFHFAQAECHTMLQNPEVYCPCMKYEYGEVFNDTQEHGSLLGSNQTIQLGRLGDG